MCAWHASGTPACSTAAAGVQEHALPGRHRQRITTLAQPEHRRLQPADAIDKQPPAFGRVQLAHLDRVTHAVASTHRHRPGRILNHQRPAPGPVPAGRGRIGDDLHPVDLRIRGQISDHRRWHVDPPRRPALDDRCRQPEPLITVRGAIQRHLQHRHRRLLRQPQPRAHHQIAEHRIASRPPAAETLPGQASRIQPADTAIPPQAVRGRRHPLDPLPGRVMRICRRALSARYPVAGQARVHRRPAAGGLRDRIDSDMAAPNRPLVELVDRGHLTVPRRPVDTRPIIIAAPPAQIGQMVCRAGVTP